MNCDEARPLLNPLCDGELATRDSALILEHLNSCLSCQSEWSDLERLRARFRAAREASNPSDELRQRIQSELKNESQPGTVVPLNSKLLAVATIITASLAVVSFLFFFNNSFHTVAPAPFSRSYAGASLAGLVDSIDSPGQDFVDLQRLDRAIGYDLKFIRIPDWRVRRFGALKLPSGDMIARMEFKRENRNSEANQTASLGLPSSGSRLCCYQAPLGSIKPDEACQTSNEVIGGKRVVLGCYRSLNFALWSQNNRDYLLVTDMSREQLSSIVGSV